MYVRMYVCAFSCLCAFGYICVHMCAYSLTCLHVYANTRIFVCVCICVYICACVRIHVHICAYASVCVCICVHMCAEVAVCLHVCAYVCTCVCICVHRCAKIDEIHHRTGMHLDQDSNRYLISVDVCMLEHIQAGLMHRVIHAGTTGTRKMSKT